MRCGGGGGKRAQGETLGIPTLGNGPRKNPQRILKGSLGTTKMVKGGPGGAFRGRM